MTKTGSNTTLDPAEDSVEHNKKTIETFYRAFQMRDGETMARAYADNAHFEDAVFKLNGARIGSMWKMLCSNGQDLKIEFSNITATADKGQATWVAEYTFSVTGRRVTNRINAFFEFKDGQIISHHDVCSFWR
jgi:ketosteroid isomerase-like protein